MTAGRSKRMLPGMYVPRAFAGDPEVARELLHARPFATVVGVTDGTPEIAHLPLLVETPQDEAPLRVSGHVARASPFARLVASGAPVTAAFHGPEGYVSASTYEAPHEQVPTWNYAVVHVRGRLRALDDAALVEQLGAMAERFEHGPVRWHPGLLSPDFFAELRRGIVGFAIDVEAVEAKLKLSQNRSRPDRDRVLAAFAASDQPRDREVAALMQRLQAPADAR